MSERPKWYTNLLCRHCGEKVLVGAKSEAASFHRPTVGEPWAAHARCREEGMSTREIGDVLGVDHKTVVNDHHATGENSPLDAEEATPDSERDPVTGENSPPATENEPTPAEKDRARKEERLAEIRGVRLGERGDRKSPLAVSGDSAKGLASELGVSEPTARRKRQNAKRIKRA